MSATSSKSFASLWPSDGHQVTSSSTAEIQSRDASLRVLTTYELLEMILRHLPWNQLFVLRRVSQLWKEVLTRSIDLQTKQFVYSPLQPLKPTRSIHRESLHGGYRVLYRAKHFTMGPAAPSAEALPQPYHFESEGPAVSGLTPAGSGGVIASWNLTDAGETLHFSIGLGGLIEAETTASSKNETWRAMHVASPPLEAIDLDFLPDVPEYGYSLTVRNATGIRLGELYEWTWKLGRLFERSTGHRLDGRMAVASFWVRILE